MSSLKFDNKVCLVCGDKSTGKHYDVMTCEACKLFFKNNALKNWGDFRCYLGGNCDIEVRSRKHCKRCRLDKCLAVGMKTKLILNDKQKQLRRALIENNRKTKQKVISKKTLETMDSTQELIRYETNNSSDELINDLSTEMIINTQANQMSGLGDYEQNTEINCFNSVIPIMRPVTDYSNTYDEIEGTKLRELLDILKGMPIVITGPTDKTFVDNIMDALNLLVLKCDDYIQDVIKLFKRLNSFQSICQSDQMILIKYSLLEIKILRLISNFNFEGQYWTLDTENNCSTLMKLDLFKQINFVAQPFRPYYDYKNFYQNMGLDWNSDNLIIDLLTAILLFNAERPNLINREMIKDQQNIYIHLLQRYLQMKYRSDLLSNAKYMRLISNLRYLNNLNNKVPEIAKHVKCVPPLLREILDRDNYL